MSISLHWLRISLALLVMCWVFFFFNWKPKFILPLSSLKKRNRILYNVLIWTSVLIAIILPLNLSFVSDKQVIIQKDVPIQIILDVSLSMAANDLSPSRFTAAKSSLISLVQKLDGYYVSLITYSWKPFVYIPFSSSSSAVVRKLSSMNLGDFPPIKDFLWTAIGDAMLLGVQNLQLFAHHENYKPWIVILITDGDSNIGYDPLQIMSYYQKIQVPLFVLGVGQEDYLIGRDTFNDTITTNINLSLLQQLADKTWGEFYRILGKQSFDSFFSELSDTIVAHQQQRIENILWNLNHYLIILLVLLLIVILSFRIMMISHSRK